jgi:hypothetical protein
MNPGGRTRRTYAPLIERRSVCPRSGWITSSAAQLKQLVFLVKLRTFVAVDMRGGMPMSGC